MPNLAIAGTYCFRTAGPAIAGNKNLKTPIFDQSYVGDLRSYDAFPVCAEAGLYHFDLP